MIDILKSLDIKNGKDFYKIKRNLELMEWINNHELFSDESFMERIYILLNGRDKCVNGNKKKINEFTLGWQYCKSNCQCQRENQATKITELYKSRDEEIKQRIKDKTKQTILERYGVENASQSEIIKKKKKQTNLEKFGVECNLILDITKEKIKKTMIEKYGVEHPAQNFEILKKMKKTNIERYGVSNISQSENIKEQKKQTIMMNYGVEFPLQSEILKEKVKQTNFSKFGTEYFSQTDIFKENTKNTNLDRYGTEFPTQADEIKEKTKETNLKKYNVEYTFQSEVIKEKIKETMLERYDVESFNQKHISNENMKILNNKEKFIQILEENSLTETAILLGVSYSTIGKNCAKYNIDLPSSSYELAIISFLKKHNINYKLHDRQIISPQEIDIVLPDYKIGIEFCGLYWHGESILLNRNIDGKNYHLNKLNSMNNQGYKLITIFEDEWLYKREIVQSRLLHLLKLSEKGIGARKLLIQETSNKETRDFLNKYHIQGVGAYGYAKYGAYDTSGIFPELVAVMTFSKPRIAMGRTSGADELLRFATNGKNYPGVASRLFRRFIKEHNPAEVISYADRRWSDGNLYNQLGFKFVHSSQPNYFYTNLKTIIREHRFNYRKDRIINLVNNGNEKTEIEIMNELGRDRIFDCGSLKFLWTK